MFAAMEISRNAAGNKILIERVFGSTMAKARQPSFFLSIATSLRDATVNTPDSAREVSVFTVHPNAIIPSVIRITKGLLAHLYPAYDYRADEFTVLDIHSATLLGNDREIQLQMMREIVTKTQVRGVGNHDEFKFWRQVESCRGVWLLVFYDAVAFVVSHNRPAGNSKDWCVRQLVRLSLERSRRPLCVAFRESAA
jgi:hypothetical protein